MYEKGLHEAKNVCVCEYLCVSVSVCVFVCASVCLGGGGVVKIDGEAPCLLITEHYDLVSGLP